jgi:hypothetical protein
VDKGIFSTYRQGENRVTASILAVLRSLVLPRIEFILGALLGEEFTLVSFQNQPAKGAAGVPDAEITARARVLLETKTERDALKKDQLTRHLERLMGERDGRLLVLTPDQSEPAVIKEVRDERLVWASFADLNQAINDLLGQENEVVSEREEFLLRELQKMIEADGLLQPAKNVVVVAARVAWPDYRALRAYVTRANRAFRQVEYMAFYSEGQIQPIVPKILRREPEIEFKPGLHSGQMGEVVQGILNAQGRPWNPDKAMVFLLSAPDDPRTIRLSQPVENDLDGAFVQGQRYVTLTDLQMARTTSELVEKSE